MRAGADMSSVGAGVPDSCKKNGRTNGDKTQTGVN